MVKNKKIKIIITAFLILLILGVLGGFIYYKVVYQPKQNLKNLQQDTEIIGEYIVENISTGEYVIGEFYYLTNTNESNKLIIEDELVEKAVSNTEFIYVYTLDKNTVLLSEGAFFQSVGGYIFTNKNQQISNPYDVPDVLGYDAPIWTEKINDYLYRWSGGL